MESAEFLRWLYLAALALCVYYVRQTLESLRTVRHDVNDIKTAIALLQNAVQTATGKQVWVPPRAVGSE